MPKIEIPNYTTEDYLNTTEPYEFIKKNSKNSFEELQLQIRMEEQAKGVGIKKFPELYMLFKQSYYLKGEKQCQEKNQITEKH